MPHPVVCIVCHPKRQFPSPHRIRAYFSQFFLGQCYVVPFHPVILFPDQCYWNHLLLPFMMLWRNSLPTSAKLWEHVLFTEVCATPVASKEASGHKLFTISWTTHCPVQISAAISTILAPLAVFISLKCLTHHLDTASTDAGISVCVLKVCINNYVKISSFTRNVITACCQNNVSSPAIFLHRAIITWWGQVMWFLLLYETSHRSSHHILGIVILPSICNSTISMNFSTTFMHNHITFCKYVIYVILVIYIFKNITTLKWTWYNSVIILVSVWQPVIECLQLYSYSSC